MVFFLSGKVTTKRDISRYYSIYEKADHTFVHNCIPVLFL
jgi:hypothetical protein